MKIKFYQLKGNSDEQVDPNEQEKSFKDYLVEVEEPGKSFNKSPGVWLIIGTDKDPEKPQPICLQVAGTNDVWGEMKDDIGLLNDDCYPKPELVKKNWVNQFGEYQFSYFDYADQGRKMLYHFIASHYKDINFVCVDCGEQYYQKNKTGNRYELEKYVAHSTFSKFWRDGKPFDKGCPDQGKRTKTGKLYRGQEGIEDIKLEKKEWNINNKERISDILKNNGNINLNILDNFLEKIKISDDTNPVSSNI